MNVTIGKYIPGNSFIHRMDPRIKLFTNIVFIVLVFITKSFIVEGILLFPIILSFLISKLKKKQLLTSMMPVFFIGLFLFIINVFIVNKDNNPKIIIYFHWYKFNISNIAIYRTLLIMIRIYIMILITTLLTATTRPTGITKGVESLLYPLKFIFIPIHIIAMIISIALRFIPTLLEESQRIMKAQASRGVDFKNGNIKSKSKSMMTLIIPLFISAFSKAEDLGNAMETRGYDPYEKRTKYRNYPIKISDILILLFVISLFIFVILQNVNYIYIPTWMN